MKTCRSCKWWGRYRTNQCDIIDIGDEEEVIPTNGAVIIVKVQDDSGLSTGLRTGPDFSCVLHEEKT